MGIWAFSTKAPIRQVDLQREQTETGTADIFWLRADVGSAGLEPDEAEWLYNALGALLEARMRSQSQPPGEIAAIPRDLRCWHLFTADGVCSKCGATREQAEAELKR